MLSAVAGGPSASLGDYGMRSRILTSIPNPVSQLIFHVQPSNVATNTNISPAVVVYAADGGGSPVAGFTGNITMSVHSGTGTLSGTLVIPCVAGVATFSDLHLDTAGAFTLRASGASHTVDSASFTVTAPSSGFALVASGSGATTDGGTTATTNPALNTTGSNLLIIGSGSLGSAATPAPSDSKMDSWTTLGVAADATNKASAYYSVPAFVGAAHTFTVTQAGSFPAMGALAFSGAALAPFDQSSTGAAASATTIQPGSITPAAAGALLVAVICFSADPGTLSIDSSFGPPVIFLNVNAGVSFGFAMAYKIKGASDATAENPTWTSANTIAMATRMHCFLHA